MWKVHCEVSNEYVLSKIDCNVPQEKTPYPYLPINAFQYPTYLST